MRIFISYNIMSFFSLRFVFNQKRMQLIQLYRQVPNLSQTNYGVPKGIGE